MTPQVYEIFLDLRMGAALTFCSTQAINLHTYIFLAVIFNKIILKFRSSDKIKSLGDPVFRLDSLVLRSGDKQRKNYLYLKFYKMYAKEKEIFSNFPVFQ